MVAGSSAYKYRGAPRADYLLRSSDLSGNFNGAVGTFSAWLRIDGGDGYPLGAPMTILHAGLDFFVERTAGYALRVYARDVDDNVLMDFISTGGISSGSKWHHLLASWDSAFGLYHLYLNDEDRYFEISSELGNIDYTQDAWAVGAETDGSLRFDGAIAELYFIHYYFNFSVEANRRKFITAAKTPAYLGADGSTPASLTPILYLPNGYNVNSGSGGNFTVNGDPKPEVGPAGVTPNWFGTKSEDRPY
jgi:hypothetical protein